MAPLTRAHRAKASCNGEPIEPLSPALPLTSTPTPRRNHTRFDEDDVPAAPATSKPEGAADPQDSEKLDPKEIADSQENSDASDSDDEAPEETTLGAGKEEALKRDDEARKAAEAQKDAARKKRKERDTQLKTQKAGADARKRQRLDEAASQLTLEASKAAVEAETEVEAMDEAENEDKEQDAEDTSAVAPIEKTRLPKLLPESLLAAVASRPEENSDSEGSEDDTPVPPGQPSKHLEKNRRRREQRRRNKVLKKGVVSVKVLSDDAATRKNLAPPVVRNVGNVKEAWLYNRRGGVERRIVGRGFVRK